MNEITVLIVDDEEDMRDLVSMYLENSGFICLKAKDGMEALHLLKEQSIDLILLDVMMPTLDGFSFTLKIREQSSVPIIFLTARGEEWDRVHGLKIGADDYIVKPFSPGELVARIDAVLRRATQGVSKEDNFRAYGPILINEKGRKVLVNEKVVSLTLKEFDLLQYFCMHLGQALSREQLLQGVWGYDYTGNARTVDTHIKTLRIKLNEAGDLIQTVWGIGYKFEV